MLANIYLLPESFCSLHPPVVVGREATVRIEMITNGIE